MIDYSLGYETDDGHHGLGVSEAAPPVAFTARRHDTESPHDNEEIVYRPERTCEMVEMPTGEKAVYSDTDEIIWHCQFCHAERAIYEFGEDGDVWAAAPKFCPECGARVAV